MSNDDIDDIDEFAVRRLARRGGGGYITKDGERFVAPKPVFGEELRPLSSFSRWLWNRFSYSDDVDDDD